MSENIWNIEHVLLVPHIRLKVPPWFQFPLSETHRVQGLRLIWMYYGAAPAYSGYD
jgi:hypothetical protein